MKYQLFMKNVENQPSVHQWVKDVMKKLDDHDVVDVLHDLDLLKSIFQVKCNDICVKYQSK